MIAIGVANPLWLSSRDPHRDPVVARTMPLYAHNGTVTGSVVFGARVGTTRRVRLIADGLATGRASNSLCG